MTVEHRTAARGGRVAKVVGIFVGLFVPVALVGGTMSSPVSAAADVNMVPLVPARLLESRVGSGLTTIDGQDQGVGRINARATYTLDVAGRGGVAADAEAVMLNVTAVSPDGPGYLTVFPCTPERPTASHVNYVAGSVAPNSVLAKVSPSGTVCIFSLAATDVIVDVTGYVPPAGAPVSVDPARLVETRSSAPVHVTVDGKFEGIGRMKAGETIMFKATGRAGVPSAAEAVYLNVTAIFPDGFGFLTVYPCGSARPGTSNVNYGPNEVSPNAVLATVGDGGMVCIYSKAGADIIADVNAYLPLGGNRVSIQPARCADTRQPDGKTFDGLFEGDGPIAAEGTYQITVGGRCNISPDASAAYLNVTAVAPEAAGFLTVWPCDEPRPLTSNVNYGPGEVRPNAVLSKISLDNNGQVCVFSKARSDVIVDANGYVPAPGLFGIIEVASGNRATCVLMGDGTVRCAGQGGYLGDGTLDESYDPLIVPGLNDVESIEAGEAGHCAVLADSTAMCWGLNKQGQLGIGSTEGTAGDAFQRQFSPVAVKNLSGIVDISIYSEHACAITDDDDDGDGDSVWCWGKNNYLQLGDGTNETRTVPTKVVGLPPGMVPADVEAGGSHTCLRFEDGSVSCWGHGGRVGRNVGGSGGQPPTQIPSLSGVADLSAGRNHTCAILADSSVTCWGLNNADVVLGDRDNVLEPLLPDKVKGISGAVEVVAGYEATCVRLGDGTASCWGYNQFGQLGDGSPAAEGELKPVQMLTEHDGDIVGVSNNGWWSCALLDDSSVVCWGYNNRGNLGARLTDHSATPVVFGSGDQTT